MTIPDPLIGTHTAPAVVVSALPRHPGPDALVAGTVAPEVVAGVLLGTTPVTVADTPPGLVAVISGLTAIEEEPTEAVVEEAVVIEVVVEEAAVEEEIVAEDAVVETELTPHSTADKGELDIPTDSLGSREALTVWLRSLGSSNGTPPPSQMCL